MNWKLSNALMVILFAICLNGCKLSQVKEKFPDRPSGWSCTYFFDSERSPHILIEEIKKANSDERLLELAKTIKSLRKDRTQFLCNDLVNTVLEKQFHFADPVMQKARSMPLRTAEAYDEYIFKKLNKCK